jgi:hypothetical protein
MLSFRGWEIGQFSPAPRAASSKPAWSMRGPASHREDCLTLRFPCSSDSEQVDLLADAIGR